MGWLVSLLTGPFVKMALGLGDKFLSAYLKAKDVDLEKFRTLTDDQKAVALAGIGFETAKLSAEANVVVAAMTHRVWWWAWALFVFPIGFYSAVIFVTSTIPALNGWVVLRVPAEQEAWAHMIIPTIFALQTGSGVVAAVVKGFGKR